MLGECLGHEVFDHASVVSLVLDLGLKRDPSRGRSQFVCIGSHLPLTYKGPLQASPFMPLAGCAHWQRNA